MLDIAFEAFHIIGKGLYPLGCDPAKGSGLFPREPFFDLDVTGLGQFVELDAQVPCRGLGLFLDEVEIGFLHANQDGHDGQSQFGVEERVEVLKHFQAFFTVLQ